MSEQGKRRPGRPAGVSLPVVRSMRFAAEDLARLEALRARAGDRTVNETVRRLIREAARREGVG